MSEKEISEYMQTLLKEDHNDLLDRYGDFAVQDCALCVGSGFVYKQHNRTTRCPSCNGTGVDE